MKQEYSRDGYYLVQGLINDEYLNDIRTAMSIFDGKVKSYGVRDLMNKVPCVRDAALSAPLIDLAKEILGDDVRPVRSVFFDKIEGANWNVAWHQDTSIALNSKHDVEGFGPWSEKQGVVHAEPPANYLSNTLTLRIHLDKADADNGGLRVVPGTHVNGRVKSREILEIVENADVVECDANPGDVLLMNPLLFHASRKSKHPAHRRIIHIDYSAMELPEPLAWFESL